mmetsp:Transcript_39289/g.93060  ORF Transcript_39289/g.93060 Transcript_39289/m.93060 type:complete len:293 (-) Transcript_39289:148-1026(-)
MQKGLLHADHLAFHNLLRRGRGVQVDGRVDWLDGEVLRRHDLGELLREVASCGGGLPRRCHLGEGLRLLQEVLLRKAAALLDGCLVADDLPGRSARQQLPKLHDEVHVLLLELVRTGLVDPRLAGVSLGLLHVLVLRQLPDAHLPLDGVDAEEVLRRLLKHPREVDERDDLLEALLEAVLAARLGRLLSRGRWLLRLLLLSRALLRLRVLAPPRRGLLLPRLPRDLDLLIDRVLQEALELPELVDHGNPARLALHHLRLILIDFLPCSHGLLDLLCFVKLLLDCPHPFRQCN